MRGVFEECFKCVDVQESFRIGLSWRGTQATPRAFFVDFSISFQSFARPLNEKHVHKASAFDAEVEERSRTK